MDDRHQRFYDHAGAADGGREIARFQKGLWSFNIMPGDYAQNVKSRLVFEWVLFFVWKNSLGELPSYKIHPGRRPIKKYPLCWAQPRSSYPYPLLACSNQLKPHNPLPYQIGQLKKRLLGKERALLSANLTAIIMFIISKPPLLLGEFNKSAPFFGLSLCCLDLSKTLGIVLGLSKE